MKGVDNEEKILLIVGLIVIVGIAYGGHYFYQLQKYEELMPTVTINTVDLKSLEDGTYTGFFDAYLVSAKVNVLIENHKIIDISLIKYKYERGKPAEKILNSVLKEQKLSCRHYFRCNK